MVTITMHKLLILVTKRGGGQKGRTGRTEYLIMQTQKMCNKCWDVNTRYDMHSG